MQATILSKVYQVMTAYVQDGFQNNESCPEAWDNGNVFGFWIVY